MVRRTVLSWVVPRNGQMYGIRGEGWHGARGGVVGEKEKLEAKGGKEGTGLVFQEKALLLLAVVLQGDTTATEDHFTCFMQAH